MTYAPLGANMIKWVKPNGNKITTNEEEATIEKAVALGWKEDKPKKKKK